MCCVLFARYKSGRRDGRTKGGCRRATSESEEEGGGARAVAVRTFQCARWQSRPQYGVRHLAQWLPAGALPHTTHARAPPAAAVVGVAAEEEDDIGTADRSLCSSVVVR